MGPGFPLPLISISFRNTEVTVEWPELTSLRKQAFLEIDCSTRQQFSENLPVMRQVFFEKLNPKPFSENSIGRRHQFSDKPHPLVNPKHPNTIAFLCTPILITPVPLSRRSYLRQVNNLKFNSNCMFSGCR